MKSMNKVLITLIFSMFFLTGVYYTPLLVKAYSYLELGDLTYTIGNEGIPERQFITMSNGLHSVYAWFVGLNELRINVLAYEGVLECNYTISLSGSGFLANGAITLAQINDNEVIIFFYCFGNHNPEYSKGAVSRLNVITFQHTEYEHNSFTTNIGNANSRGRCSNMINISNVYTFTLTHQYDSYGHVAVATFDIDTNTLSQDFVGSNAVPVGNTYVQTPILFNISDTLFYYWHFIEDGYASTYLIDTSGNTITHICDSPLGGKMDFNRYFDIIDYGIKTNTVGSDTYIYPYLIYSTSYVLGTVDQWFDIVIFRQCFNNTISDSYLLENTIKASAKSPSSWISPNPPFAVGVLKNIGNPYNWYEYYANYEGLEGGSPVYSLSKMEIRLGNNTLEAFYDLDSTPTIYSDEQTSELPFGFENNEDVIFKEEHSNFNFCLRGSASKLIHIYYGTQSLADFFTANINYTPNDTPLIQNKQYTFTVVVLNNGAYYQNALVLFYVDGNLVASKPTNVVGEITQKIAYASVGTHNMTIQIFKYNSYSEAVIEDTSTYIVISSTATPTPPSDIDYGQFSGSVINVVIDMLPTLLVVFVPAFGAGKYMGLLGFLGGMSIGVVIAVSSGVLPQYYIYFMLLILVMGVVFIIRSGGANTQTGVKM